MTTAVLKTLCDQVRWCEPDTLEATVELALEIAREGREGRRIGTLFTLFVVPVVYTLVSRHHGATTTTPELAGSGAGGVPVAKPSPAGAQRSASEGEKAASIG